MKPSVLITLVFFIASFSSCKKLGLCSDDELQLTKTSFTGNELRINGIYHANFDNGTGTALVVFYSNGVFCTRVKNETTLSEIEAEIMDGSFYSEQKNLKGCWGLYTVNGTSITTDSWKVTQGCKPTIQLEGSIINDSTLQIGNLLFKDNTELTYHFKEFDPKPDSLNSFIH